MNSATEPLSREAFEARLLDAVAAWPYVRTRFYRALASGRCPRPVLQTYARSTHLSASLFCASIAELVKQAPDSQARLILLENLMEEEGIVLRADRGLVLRADQSHPALALRFVHATGADELSLGDATHATGEGRDLIRQGRWVEAVAHLLVGQELKFSEVSGVWFDLLRAYGFADRDLAFFAVHTEVDCAHGRQALDLVLDRARSRAEQEAAIGAAGRGARAWFEFHGGEARTEAPVPAHA